MLQYVDNFDIINISTDRAVKLIIEFIENLQIGEVIADGKQHQKSS